MPKVTVEFLRAEVLPNNAGFLFQTVDGQQYPFADIQEVRDFVASLDTQENAIKFGIAKLLFQEPNLIAGTGGKLTYLIGKAIDLEAVSASQVVIR